MNSPLEQALHRHRPAPRTLVRDRRGRPRLYRLDAELIADTVADRTTDPTSQPATPRRPRIVRVQDEVRGVRRNVQDAAGAVLTWLSGVLAHEGEGDLDGVLRQLLRPSDDCKDVNYAALAEQVERATGVKLTAKRAQTAVRHLRKAHAARHAGNAQASQAPVPSPLLGLIESLRPRLLAQREGLFSDDASEHVCEARRLLGTELLSAVRCAAGQVIDRGFGEHLAESLDVATIERRYLDFLRDRIRQADEPTRQDASAEEEVQRLALLLSRFDGSAAHHVQLVMHGSSVAQRLLGADSLPGLLAQLNVRVVGRSLIDTELYVGEMLRIAEQADALHDDPATDRYLRFARRLPESQRVPAARRIASYARSNAATRLYDRLFTGELRADAPAPWLPTLRASRGTPPTCLEVADDTLATMTQRDSGFVLTMTGELVAGTVHARITGDTTRIDALLRRLGPDKSLERLESLIRFDNHDALVAEARRHVERVHPCLHRALVVV